MSKNNPVLLDLSSDEDDNVASRVRVSVEHADDGASLEDKPPSKKAKQLKPLYPIFASMRKDPPTKPPAKDPQAKPLQTLVGGLVSKPASTKKKKAPLDAKKIRANAAQKIKAEMTSEQYQATRAIQPFLPRSNPFCHKSKRNSVTSPKLNCTLTCWCGQMCIRKTCYALVESVDLAQR